METVAACEFCGRDEARWLWSSTATDPAQRMACDVCHILAFNGWGLRLFSRAARLTESDDGRRWLEELLVDRERSSAPLGDERLPIAGTWRGGLVPLGWQLKDGRGWYPPDE
jgi:hypothetical protein